MFVALIISLIVESDGGTIGLIIGGMTTLAGLSVVEKTKGMAVPLDNLIEMSKQVAVPYISIYKNIKVILKETVNMYLV